MKNSLNQHRRYRWLHITFCRPLRSVAEVLRVGKMWLSGANSDAKLEHRRALLARGAKQGAVCYATVF